MIQIASGCLRGLKLKSPKDSNTRPTSERTRQALFNVLRNYAIEIEGSSQPILENALVIDLFAGTGAFGLECISNGASEVLFVEASPSCSMVLSENAKTFFKALSNQGIEDRHFHVYTAKMEKLYLKLPKARVIFCDPPYRKNFYELLMECETKHSALETKGVLLFESASDEVLEERHANAAGLRIFDRKIYGDSAVTFFVKLA